jgi:hypothetical protein
MAAFARSWRRGIGRPVWCRVACIRQNENPADRGAKAVRARNQSSVVYEPTMNATKMPTKRI